MKTAVKKNGIINPWGTDVISSLVVKRQILVEVSLAAGTIAAGNEYPWKYNDFLSKNRVRVYGVELITAAELAVSPLKRTVIPAADAVNITLDLVDTAGNLNFGKDFPCQRLRPSAYNGYTVPFRPRELDLTRTVVKLVAAGTLTTAMSVLFNVYYKYANE